MRLIEAAFLGNLDRVKALVELTPDEINTEDSFYQLRAIDAAAFKNHLNVVDYLLSQGAIIAAPANRLSLFFLLISNTQTDDESQKSVINWLRLHQHDLLKSDATLTIEHFNAVFGLKINDLCEILHCGLLPTHYAILTGNTHYKNLLPLIYNQLLPSDGYFNSCSFTFLLAKMCSWHLLAHLLDCNVSIDLNETTHNKQHVLHGITIAWILAQENHWALFKKLLSKNKTSIDLNTAPQNSFNPFYGTTLVFLLAAQKQWALFSRLTGKKSSITMINLNNGPKNDNSLSYGITIAWLLVADNQWLLLNTHSFACDIDLNARPLNERAMYQGASISCLLASKKQWPLLTHLINRHSQPFFIDLNVGPQRRERKSFGVTFAWLLVFDQQWELLNLIRRKSDKPVTIYLNAGPNEKPTVAWLLAFAKQWDLLQELVKISQNIIELDSEYEHDKQTLTTLLLTNEQMQLFEEIMVCNWGAAERCSSLPNTLKRKREQSLTFFSTLEKTPLCEESPLQTTPLITK